LDITPEVLFAESINVYFPIYFGVDRNQAVMVEDMETIIGVLGEY
jgi:hypothetical protein